MKWWYKPCKKEKIFEDLDSLLWDIFSFIRYSIGTHNVPNYYIYNENGLYDLIKGSDIDPLSITRNKAFNEIINDSNLYGFLCKSEIQMDDDIFNQYNHNKNVILNRYYENYNSDVLKETERCINMIMQKDKKKMQIKEFKLKNKDSNMPVVYISNIYTFNGICDEKEIINQIYDLSLTDEKLIFIFSYEDELIKGFTYFTFDELSIYKDIFKFLLLTGTESFTLKSYNLSEEENEKIKRKVQKMSTFAEVFFANYSTINNLF